MEWFLLTLGMHVHNEGHYICSICKIRCIMLVYLHNILFPAQKILSIYTGINISFFYCTET